MDIQELLATGGGLLLLMTIIEITPIKLNPWSAIGKGIQKMFGALGKAFNSELTKEVAELRQKLDNHILMDDRRTADVTRARILRFNNELLRDISHTKEEFLEILHEIDAYEAYCKVDEDYPNNRAELAIKNIKENYMERLKNHDFLPDSCSHKREESSDR